MTIERNVWVLAYPALDVPGQWVGHCLDLDIVSAGTSLDHAIEMTAEAVMLCAQWDTEKGFDPFARSRAPQEDWDTLERVVREGKYGSIPAGALTLVATQFRIAIQQPDGRVPANAQPTVQRLPPAWLAA